MSYKISKKKILVTGATGQIGSFLIERLIKENVEVFAVGRNKKELREILPIVESQKIKFLECDITNEKNIKKNSKFLNGIDFFVHLSSGYRFDLVNSMTSDHHTIEQDLKGTIKILKELKNLEGVLFASSVSIYGKPEYLPIDENCSVNPNHFYGVGKFGAEKILQSFTLKNKIPLTILRIAAVVGERDRSNQIIPICVNRSLKNETINVNEESSRDYIHVLDLAKAHLLALENINNLESFSEEYNVGTGQGYSVKEIIRMVKEITGKDFLVLESPRRGGDPPILVANSEKIKKELSWYPKYSIKDIIKSAWEWHQNNLQS